MTPISDLAIGARHDRAMKAIHRWLAPGALGLVLLAAPAGAAELDGVWRGTLNLDNPRAHEPHVETKAALHVRDGGTTGEIYIERLGRALPIGTLARHPGGALDVHAGGVPSVALRGLRFARNSFDGSATYEDEDRVTWSGKASFHRIAQLDAPSGKPKCDGAPSSLRVLCGAWSGISLRGQPKLLIVNSVIRNRQKIAWELKARQEWGGDSDLASAGMGFPYTIYITDEELPLAALQLRTTGRLAYRFDIGDDALTGGSLTDAADRTVYTRAR